MPRFMGHKYTWQKPFGSERHSWELRGPLGGIHFHVGITRGYDPSCGLEFHHTRATGFRCEEAPDHLNCPVTGEPCWHDGTSLYALETLWPQIQPCLTYGNHEAVFSLLECEYDERFKVFEIETRRRAYNAMAVQS